MPEEYTANQDGSVTFGEFANGTQVRLREYKGKQYVDVRKFVKGYPTTKGICILTDHISDCITLLEKVEQNIAKHKQP